MHRESDEKAAAPFAGAPAQLVEKPALAIKPEQVFLQAESSGWFVANRSFFVGIIKRGRKRVAIRKQYALVLGNEHTPLMGVCSAYIFANNLV